MKFIYSLMIIIGTFFGSINSLPIYEPINNNIVELEYNAIVPPSPPPAPPGPIEQITNLFEPFEIVQIPIRQI